MTLNKLKTNLKNSNTDSYKLGLSGANSRIVIGNSFCRVEGFSDEHVELIRTTLTYDNEEVIYELAQAKIQLGMAFRYRNSQKIAWQKRRIVELEENLKTCWLKGNKFPTGHLTLVKDALSNVGLKFKLVDERELNAVKVEYPWQKEMNPPRYYQDDMVDQAIIHHRGVFESAVGTGKTYIAQMIIQVLQVPVLFISPSKDLCSQTVDDFVAAFGENKVEYIESAKAAKTDKPIRICTVHTLSALVKAKKLEPLLKGLGMIMIDEVHHAGAKSYTDLLPYFDHIYYRFGFSGTFLRNDSRTLDMWGFLSTVLYRYSAATAMADGFLTPFEVVVHDVEGSRSNTYHSEYTRNYCNNSELLGKLRQMFTQEIPEDAQVLILVGRKEKSGHIIHEYLNELGISNEYVSGDSKRAYVKQVLLNFNNKKTRVLVGSTIIGEGIDIRSTDHLIMAQGGKSEIAVTQAVGRLVRLFKGKTKGFLHDFRFSNTKYMTKHLIKRLEIYKKNFNGDVKDVESKS